MNNLNKIPIHDSSLRHSTGQAVYIDDMPEQENLLHGAPVLSKVACGKISRDLLSEKVTNNKISCTDEGKDFYGRVLGECFVNGESLSSYLVREGFAFAYRKYSNKYIEDEEYAKFNKLGMWSMEFQYPWDYRKNNK